jgi:DNA-binding NarL/FixJ family response regulator
MPLVRILIADDHAIIRRGLRALLEHEPGFEIVAEACDGREAVELAERELPHVAILDVSMPILNGLEAARQISSKLSEIQLVMLTVHADECYLLNALKAGARGYVLKGSAEFEIVEAVRAVSQGKAYFSPKVSKVLADEYMRYLEARQVEDSYDLLTSRERQILQLLAEGQSNKYIGNILDLSPTTVICHRQHIFQKLNFHGLADLMLYAIRKGVIPSSRDAVV